jgi:hypothetical protein
MLLQLANPSPFATPRTNQGSFTEPSFLDCQLALKGWRSFKQTLWYSGACCVRARPPVNLPLLEVSKSCRRRECNLPEHSLLFIL